MNLQLVKKPGTGILAEYRILLRGQDIGGVSQWGENSYMANWSYGTRSWSGHDAASPEAAMTIVRTAVLQEKRRKEALPIMSEQVTVQMKATVTTDGNPEDVRDRSIRQPMSSADAEKLILFPTLDEALEFFKSHVSYLDDIIEFEWFEIAGKRLYKDDWPFG